MLKRGYRFCLIGLVSSLMVLGACADDQKTSEVVTPSPASQKLPVATALPTPPLAPPSPEAATPTFDLSPTPTIATPSPTARFTPTLSALERSILTSKAELTIAAAPMDIQIKPTPANWQSRWLASIPCRPPCWEGLIPGKTTAEEAVQILKASPIASFAYIRNSDYGGTVSWRWANGKPGGEAELKFKDGKRIVTRIRPVIDYVSLKEVMRVYGEPSYISVHALPTSDHGKTLDYYWEIIYDPLGFSIRRSSQDKNFLTPDSLFEPPDFYEANTIEQIYAPRANGSNERVALSKWQGFKEFYEYCNQKAFCFGSGR